MFVALAVLTVVIGFVALAAKGLWWGYDDASQQDILMFRYRAPHGRERDVTLTTWEIDGLLLTGKEESTGEPRTFRIDRILFWYGPPPPEARWTAPGSTLSGPRGRLP